MPDTQKILEEFDKLKLCSCPNGHLCMDTEYIIKAFMVKYLEVVAKEEKIKTKKIVDDVKDSLYKIQRMGVIDFRGEKLEVITRYQAVNTINLSGLPYTSISGTGRSD